MHAVTLNDGDMVSIKLCGRFDFESRHVFTNAYTAMLESPGLKQIEVDLEEVDYVDSAALGMLLILRDKASSQTVTLARPRGRVKSILEIANFKKLFAIR